ncbi:histone acetyltransferase htatip, partial [Phakopsora pachyrhizi]
STDLKPLPLISSPNTVSLGSIITRCKVFAKRLDEKDPVKAEILGIRTVKPSRRSRFAKPLDDSNELESENGSGDKEEERLEFYLHWIGYNKRLDEWVTGSRIRLDRSIEWPTATSSSTSSTSTPTNSSVPSSGKLPRKSTPPTTANQQKRESSKLRRVALKNSQKLTKKQQLLQKKQRQQQQQQQQQQQNNSPSKKKNINKKNFSNKDTPSSPTKQADVESGVSEDDDDEDKGEMVEAHDDDDGDDRMDEDEDEDDEDDEEDEEDEDEMEIDQSPSQFSKQDEIEKLRTSGSMTQSHHEISRVKNLDRIQIGKHEVEAWYFSPYPIEFAHTPILYICEFCLLFYGSEFQLYRHRQKCTLLHPPGNEIYRADDIHFFEIDGRKQKTWCRNLSLLSKCFLDHKTLYYDVDPFMYYVMCQRDSNGLHMIGYFSKEKESAENYNVACILTLPQYQRLGFGKLLIEFSYELSKKEGKLGSPEKPLSDLGLLSYRAYWEEVIVGFILESLDRNEDVSIDEIAQKTAIVHADIMHVCQALQMLKYHNKQHIFCLSEAIIERYQKMKRKKRRRIQTNQLSWKPPVFSRAQLQFGF